MHGWVLPDLALFLGLAARPPRARLTSSGPEDRLQAGAQAEQISLRCRSEIDQKAPSEEGSSSQRLAGWLFLQMEIVCRLSIWCASIETSNADCSIWHEGLSPCPIVLAKNKIGGGPAGVLGYTCVWARFTIHAYVKALCMSLPLR